MLIKNLNELAFYLALWYTPFFTADASIALRKAYCNCFGGSGKGVLCYIKLKTHTETRAKPKTQHQCQPTVGFLSGFVCCASSCWIICQAQRVGNFIFFFFVVVFICSTQHSTCDIGHRAAWGLFIFFFLLFSSSIYNIVSFLRSQTRKPKLDFGKRNTQIAEHNYDTNTRVDNINTI